MKEDSAVTPQPTRGRPARVYDLNNPEDVRLKADAERKRLARARRKDDELSEAETISQMWLRNSTRFAAENPKEYFELQDRHDEVMALEAEIDEVCAGVAAGKRAGVAHEENKSDWPNIFPMPDVCYADARASVEQHGSFNFGCAERMEDFRPPWNAKHSDTENWEHRFYGFHLKLNSEAFPKSREALILYALRTGDQNLDWGVVDDAVNSWLAEPWSSANSREVQTLITKYRESKSPTRNSAPEPEPISRQHGPNHYKEYGQIPPTFFQSQIGS